MDNKERNSFIKNLVEVFDKSKLNSLEFKDDDLEIKLNKGLQQNMIAVPLTESREEANINHSMQHLNNSVASTSDVKLDVNNNVDNYANNEGAVKSPTVGVIYTRPTPDEPDYIVRGSSVKEGDTLFLLEVMKVFSPIVAHKSGVVKDVLITNNRIVEYNEVLAIIE